ncbi:MAG: DUF2264 domain-containing protein [Opitutales bacterium]|jgi:hypothetical protein|nr:DUF2264 domain-containing protein [Opitutales bacterium]MDP4644408.1 DUF2264 domain-containing protein [Opitutales bacterium]MDP4777874.1 DUF2264 domain-containing protein [Opitutales bacterium]MDP5079837.1 DUF2264 domain-containing protein [Opitutales bacterium]
MTTQLVDSSAYPKDWSESYRLFFSYASDLVAPLLGLVQPDLPGIPIHGPASDHDAKADDLESFVRPLMMIAHWLPSAESCDDPEIQSQVQKAKQWLVNSVRLGTDKAHPRYWGTSRNIHQNQVEMGLFAVALRMNDGYIYELLADDAKASLCEWLATGRRCGMHRNNHIYFGIFIIEFLGWAGHAEFGDDALIDFYFDQLESMYLGQGWFIDGMNETVDHYNAFAFHYYGLWWSLLYGEKNAARKARWSEWGGEFLKSYTRLISADGDYPMFGRSMTYRFNVLAPIGLAEALGVNPVSSGAARRLCRLNLEYFLKRPIYQGQNCLSIGYVDQNESMAESYSCGGSPYWAAKGFSFMSLPPEHPFWNDEEQPIPSESGDSVTVLKRAGLVIRNFDGRSEIFNAGVAVAICNTRFGPFKWGKLAYRSGIGTLLPKADKIPFDLSLVATSSDGTLYGRHMTTPLEMSERCVISSYSLGTKNEDVHISLRTIVFWKKGWLLIVHVGEAHQACTLSQGSFALAEKARIEQHGVDDGFAVIESSESAAALQNVSGYRCISHMCSRADEPRQHSHARHHQLLRADCELVEAGDFCLAAICGEGDSSGMRLPWELDHSAAGELRLVHPEVGEWNIQHPMLPELPLRS